MVFTYSPEYACMHLFDAAYVCKSSYLDAYITLYLTYGKEKALNGYNEHLRRRSALIRYDW